MPPTIDLENVINRFVLSSTANIVGTMGEAVAQYATSRTSKQLIAFLEEISTGPSQGEAEATHKRMAEQMASSTRRSWGQAKSKLRKAVYEPPRSARTAKGGMDRALNDPELVHATARGIQFGDVSVLDRHARQWARLNFGAGERGQGASESFSVRFSNLPAAEFHFEEPARPGYGLPKGSFKGPDGKWQRQGYTGRDGAFYAAGGPQQFPTKGNVGYNYLDAGIRRFFGILESEYGELFRKVLPASRRVGRPPIIGETRRISRPAA